MAYDDIATLGIKANVGDLDKAIHKLEALKASAEQTESATDRLAKQETAASNAAQRLAKDSESAARSLSGMSSKAEGLASSMSSAAKSVLGLVMAYKSMTGLNAWVQSGFRYNEQLEKAQLGIASVIAATTELADAQGKVLEGAEKFSAAQQMSVEMAKALDVASMQSPAGYIDLLTTFQRLLAPASQLGLKWQDTLDITIKMSNVLSSLGLDMQRLGTETESILTGRNINRSEVAMRLGISKEELKSWGQGEQLLANFQKRFEAFKYAGIAVEDTMEAVREYYEDVIANAAGDASTGLWTRMKQSMLEVADAFYIIDEETQKFRKTDEWQPLSDLLDKMGTALGTEMVAGVQSLVSGMKSLGTAVGAIGVDNVFSSMTTSIKVAIAALVALKIARRAATAEFTIGQGAQQQQISGLGNYARALDSAAYSVRAKAQAEVQAAAASLSAARAELQRFQAAQQGAVALRNSQQMTFARAAIEKQELALKAQLTAAEGRYTAAVSASSVVISRAVGILGMFRAAASGLLAMFGGPLGLAFTAAATAVGYLATQESSATKFAIEHADAMAMVSDNADTAREAIEAYARKLAEMTQAQRDYENSRVSRERSEITFGGSAYRQIVNDITPWAMFDDRANEIREKLQSVAEIVLPGKIDSASVQDLENLKNEIMNIASEYDRTKEAEEALKTVDSLIVLARQADMLTGSLSAATGQAQLLGAAVQGIKGLDKILDQSAFAKLTAGLKGGDKSFAQALKSGTSLTQEQIANVLKGDFSGISKEDQKKIQDARANFKAAETAAASLKKAGGSAASSVDNAAERIRRFREEIAQLNGEASKTTNNMSNKLADIEKAGKAAKMSAADIAALQEEYKTAFQTDALSKFNKELLRLEGNTAALHDIEVTEKIREWQNQFTALGLGAAEAEPKIARLKEALNKQQEYKDLQTATKFFEDIAKLSGQYGLAIEHQNMLIEYQANLYRQQLPEALQPYIDQWERLQKLQQSRDPFAGMTRGLMKYADEATNLGQQMENVVTTSFQGMEDAFVKFTETGKLSFNDLANSIISDLMRIAIRATITGPLAQGIGNLFSGFFGSLGGSSAASAVGSVAGTIGGMTFAHGGIAIPSSLPAGGGILTAPTFFNDGMHRAYAAGGLSVAGEAGPEVFMPATRMKDGNYGVRVAGLGEGSPNVNINIYNESGTQMEAQGQMQQDSAGNFNLDIIVTQIEQNMVSNAKAGRSPYTSYLDTTRGLNRASTLQRVRR